jgi:hypothetical protein
MAARGGANVAIGSVKVAIGSSVSSTGVGAALGGAYLVTSGAGQAVTGSGQLLVAATAKSETEIEKVSTNLNAPLVATTVGGFTALAVTGDVETASKAASVESVLTTGAQGLGQTAAEKGTTLFDMLDSASDLLLGSDKPKPEPEKPRQQEEEKNPEKK